MADLTIDNVIEEDEIIENETIEDEFDTSFEEINNREVLDNSYEKYNSDYSELANLLKTILQNREYTEENKEQVSTLNTNYNKSYINVIKNINNSKQIIDENKVISLESNTIPSEQEKMFNILTNNGEAQGIYKDEDGNIYINAEFLQTRGMKCISDDDVTTLHIDDKGNISLNVKNFSLESKSLNNIIGDSIKNKVDNNQESVFNALTNNGEKQGIYLQNGKVYINGEYIQAKGLSVTNGSGIQTFSIDTNGNVSAGNLEIKEGTIKIGTTTGGEVAFAVRTNGNLKIGGTTGRLNGDGTEQGIFEVTSTGTAHFRNKDDANIYSKIEDGKIQVRNGNIRFTVDDDGIQIKDMEVGSSLKMNNRGITTDSLVVNGRMVVGDGLSTTGYVRASSLAVSNKRFSADTKTINGTNQSILYLGHTMIIYGRTSFTDLTANTTATSSITFDKAFANPPMVTAIPNSSSPHQCGVGAGNVSATGCNVYLNRTNTTDTNVFWIAIGERGDSDSYPA